MEANWIIGIFFIVLGIIVLIFPNTLAGYTTLPKEEKEKINKRKLAIFVFKNLFTVGVLVIIGNYIFLWLKAPYLNYIFHPILFIGMVIILLTHQDFTA